ncbi:DUF397 domain-containing protein [Streptomyces sp. NPDC004647]|uniref:DUF397 domain-containing protein n=1 Tax=Streptomyces sp. NPDC004647 TaxID=3154671 RepID=UPI0033B9C31F
MPPEENPARTDLYKREITGPFVALCGGGTDNDGSMESCITVAELAGGGYALRGNKPEDKGRELRMSRDEMTGFAREWLRQHGG